MKSLAVGSVAGVLVLVCVATVKAQSLGDLARQEEARRKAVTTSSKVYTNETLPPPRGPVGSVAEPAPVPGLSEAPTESSTPPDGEPATDEPEAAGEQAPSDGAVATEAEWQQRLADARDAAARAQVLADALQSRISALDLDFVNRDDPAQRDVVFADRQKALAELARVTDDIERHQQAVIDIQEEARRAGVPAGWVR